MQSDAFFVANQESYDDLPAGSNPFFIYKLTEVRNYECCTMHIVAYFSTLEQLQIANETLQNENKRLISEMDELRTQVNNAYCF